MASHLVIGASRGIGFELCCQLARRSDEVLAACRTTSDELSRIPGIAVHEGVDVTSPQELRRLRHRLGTACLDSLIVTAGIAAPVSLDNLDIDALRMQFEVNAIGPLLTISTLGPCLKDGAKIGLLSTARASMSECSSGQNYGYRMSKAALNMAGCLLAHDLSDRSIAVQLLHPGSVRTDMSQGLGETEPSESARNLIARMDDLSMHNSGRFVHINGRTISW